MWQNILGTIRDFLIKYLQDYQDVFDYSNSFLVTPWGKFSSVQVMLAFILMFLMLYVYSHLCMVDDLADLKKTLNQTSKDVKLIKRLACESVREDYSSPEKEDDSSADSNRCCRAPRPKPSKQTQQKNVSGSLAERLAFIARELSSEKLKPDKEKEIISVLEALIDQKNKGDSSMGNKEKSMVKEIGIFRLFIIGSLITVLTNMLADAWKKIKYRFDEEEGKKDDC